MDNEQPEMKLKKQVIVVFDKRARLLSVSNETTELEVHGQLNSEERDRTARPEGRKFVCVDGMDNVEVLVLGMKTRNKSEAGSFSVEEQRGTNNIFNAACLIINAQGKEYVSFFLSRLLYSLLFPNSANRVSITASPLRCGDPNRNLFINYCRNAVQGSNINIGSNIQGNTFSEKLTDALIATDGPGFLEDVKVDQDIVNAIREVKATFEAEPLSSEEDIDRWLAKIIVAYRRILFEKEHTAKIDKIIGDVTNIQQIMKEMLERLPEKASKPNDSPADSSQ